MMIMMVLALAYDLVDGERPIDTQRDGDVDDGGDTQGDVHSL